MTLEEAKRRYPAEDLYQCQVCGYTAALSPGALCVPCVEGSPMPSAAPTRECTGCNGLGGDRNYKEACDECGGTGEVPAMVLTDEEARAMLAEPAAREELRFIVSYLGHNDQDANHAWMVRRIRAVLDGKDPATVEPWSEYDGVRTERVRAFGPHETTRPGAQMSDAERLAKVTRQYNELHYAVRKAANILDHKLTEDEAHEKAVQIVERMHAEIEAFHRLGSGRSGGDHRA